MARPWQWDRWLSLSPARLGPLPSPAPSAVSNSTGTLCHSAHSTQQQAHFHKHQKSRVGRRGRPEGAGAAPRP